MHKVLLGILKRRDKAECGVCKVSRLSVIKKTMKCQKWKQPISKLQLYLLDYKTAIQKTVHSAQFTLNQ